MVASPRSHLAATCPPSIGGGEKEERWAVGRGEKEERERWVGEKRRRERERLGLFACKRFLPASPGAPQGAGFGLGSPAEYLPKSGLIDVLGACVEML